MNRSFAVALCAALTCLPLAAVADDWPQFRGPSSTAPIVADGKLIVRNKEALACFELR